MLSTAAGEQHRLHAAARAPQGNTQSGLLYVAATGRRNRSAAHTYGKEPVLPVPVSVRALNRHGGRFCGPETGAGGNEAAGRLREVLTNTEQVPLKLAFDFISSKARKCKQTISRFSANLF